MNTEPQKEHHWLHQLIGDWTFEAECPMVPDQSPSKQTGSESVRSLGGLWTLGEGEGEMSGGGVAKSLMTLGYDTQIQRFVGSFVASMMTNLWIYNGTLDESGKRLTLDTEGPVFTGEGTAKYQDIIEFIDNDHRTLTSQVLAADGTWNLFMTAHYRRKR